MTAPPSRAGPLWNGWAPNAPQAQGALPLCALEWTVPRPLGGQMKAKAN